MSKILITGGAGYIGSHMALKLHELGHLVVVYDRQSNLALKELECIQADIADTQALQKTFENHAFDAVMHFAANIEVGESVADPAKYYENNVVNALKLLQAMVQHDVKRFIFSSTAAIFGEPQYTPIDEAHPKVPINPYGKTKLMVENILDDFDLAYGLKSICLRYFNAAGADPAGRTGECHEPETHLIPLVLQVATGQREDIKLFGDDYDTPDGTCLRDYIHVADLCDAHEKALGKLLEGGVSARYNLGNGQGFSVKEVIDVAASVTQKDISVTICPRRDGDPAVLVADSKLAKAELNWQPQVTDLATIIEHAWQFESKKR